jgi:hypothetical protein
MMGTLRFLLAAGSFTVVLMNPLVPAQALDETPAGQCWRAYVLCNEPAFGDETWRSACYADLTGCLRKARPPRCEPRAHDHCAVFKAECAEMVEEGDPAGIRQCESDHDACLLSFGC